MASTNVMNYARIIKKQGAENGGAKRLRKYWGM